MYSDYVEIVHCDSERMTERKWEGVEECERNKVKIRSESDFCELKKKMLIKTEGVINDVH